MVLFRSKFDEERRAKVSQSFTHRTGLSRKGIVAEVGRYAVRVRSVAVGLRALRLSYRYGMESIERLAFVEPCRFTAGL